MAKPLGRPNNLKANCFRENREDIKNRLKEEGYSVIYEYSDPANREFPEHDHEAEQPVIILKGSIAVKMDGKDYVLKEGDELRFPAKMKHSAKVGPEGCDAIIGERK